MSSTDFPGTQVDPSELDGTQTTQVDPSESEGEGQDSAAGADDDQAAE